MPASDAALRKLTPAAAARLAEDAARACLASSDAADAAASLTELAMLDDPELARCGADGIFRHAVESMGDAFEPALCDRYVEFFARVLECCRRLPAARWLDEQLDRFGLRGRDDLIRRSRALRDPRRVEGRIRKVVALSRVTLGADVAVTSVILRRTMQAFPEARVVLLGSGKAALLFAGEPRIEARRLEYPRGGGLLDRLAAWPAVVQALEQEAEGVGPGELLVTDPDSRLTQLGMLPVVADERAYRFFESRSFQRPGAGTLASLAAAWSHEVFGAGDAHPWVSLPAGAMKFASALRALEPESRWAAGNFGVGENPAKRIEDPFEKRLLAALVERGWRVLLDKGDGGEETARIERLLAGLSAAGHKVAEIVEGDGLPPRDAAVVSWRGSLAGFGALIGASDLYLGYDSACQHLAAALGVRTIDIFAGFRSPRMVERWRPSGPAEVIQIVVEPEDRAAPEKVLARVLEAL